MSSLGASQSEVLKTMNSKYHPLQLIHTLYNELQIPMARCMKQKGRDDTHAGAASFYSKRIERERGGETKGRGSTASEKGEKVRHVIPGASAEP
jgi:hypothetical protein